jgi:hypothetical protein
VAACFEQFSHDSAQETVDDLIPALPWALDRQVGLDRPRRVLGEAVPQRFHIARDQCVDVAGNDLLGLCFTHRGFLSA